METSQLLMDALSGLNLPVSALKYTGNATEYIVVNDADVRPVLFGDGIDQVWKATVQVHYFTKTNPKIKTKSIRIALRDAGFVLSSQYRTFESDTGYYHTIIEATITDASDTEE